MEQLTDLLFALTRPLAAGSAHRIHVVGAFKETGQIAQLVNADATEASISATIEGLNSRNLGELVRDGCSRAAEISTPERSFQLRGLAPICQRLDSAHGGLMPIRFHALVLFGGRIPLQRFGLLIPVTMTSSGTAALTLLPAAMLLRPTGAVRRGRCRCRLTGHPRLENQPRPRRDRRRGVLRVRPAARCRPGVHLSRRRVPEPAVRARVLPRIRSR